LPLRVYGWDSLNELFVFTTGFLHTVAFAMFPLIVS
jgi:hypothetical protein